VLAITPHTRTHSHPERRVLGATHKHSKKGGKEERMSDDDDSDFSAVGTGSDSEFEVSICAHTRAERTNAVVCLLFFKKKTLQKKKNSLTRTHQGKGEEGGTKKDKRRKKGQGN
jgi:hypothetical protein